jgi:hypothetical protein
VFTFPTGLHEARGERVLSGARNVPILKSEKIGEWVSTRDEWVLANSDEFSRRQISIEKTEERIHSFVYVLSTKDWN